MAVVNILLVEDDEVDVMAVKRAFRSLKIANPIRVAKDGIEGLSILRGTDGFEKIPHPCVILLDLNMPRMSGLEFLDEVRKDPQLHRSIVFIMTTSADEEDRLKAYNHNVSGYILKHSAGHTFVDAISMIEHFWRIIEFPDTP